jgi:uncharacterized protein (TIGR03435 family)
MFTIFVQMSLKISAVFSQPFKALTRQNSNVRSPLAVIMCCVSAATVVSAADLTAFESATVKPTAPDARGGTGVRNYPGGRLAAENMTLRDLLAFAWKVQRFQVTGEPAWADSSHYDISAKAAGNAGPDKLRGMLQPLIEDRFKVTLHRETRDLPVYALIRNPDRAIAQGLGQTREAGCDQPAQGQRASLSTACASLSAGRSSINGQGVTMSALATLLSRILDTTVVDKTGMDGSFDVRLRWAPDPRQEFGGPAPPPPAGARVPPASSGPSIFVAVQEQLGLKLDAQQGPVDVLVIEHAERPAAN